MYINDFVNPDSLSKFILPDDVTEVQQEAFQKVAAEYVVLPDGCKTIGTRAFADCDNLIYIYMPDSITSIADDAFADCDVTFICESKNFAADYAEEKNIDWMNA